MIMYPMYCVCINSLNVPHLGKVSVCSTYTICRNYWIVAVHTVWLARERQLALGVFVCVRAYL